jgi:hypothetical protein
MEVLMKLNISSTLDLIFSSAEDCIVEGNGTLFFSSYDFKIGV